MAKRYYWLKLTDDWFSQKKIKKLRKIAGGDTYTIIYLKMLLVAIKQDGKLFFDGVEENFYDELALDIDEDPENVKMTLSYLLSQHLIELAEADEYYLPETKKLTGSESESAERMRRLRDRQSSQCDANVTALLRHGDVEKEIETEKEIDKDSCPEVNSGQQAATKKTTVDNRAEGIGATAERGVRGTDARGKKIAEQDVFIHLPLNTGEMYAITTEYVDEMQKLYPAVDVKQQLRTMRGWCDANPKNRKTASGIKRFVNGWLAREQNGAPRDSRNQQAVQKNGFNNFEQRKIDWNDIEKRLTSIPPD